VVDETILICPGLGTFAVRCALLCAGPPRTLADVLDDQPHVGRVLQADEVAAEPFQAAVGCDDLGHGFHKRGLLLCKLQGQKKNPVERTGEGKSAVHFPGTLCSSQICPQSEGLSKISMFSESFYGNSIARRRSNGYPQVS
jgi:hypothetical protein